MGIDAPDDHDGAMPISPPQQKEHPLTASAHELQRAAGTLQKHAAGPAAVPSLGSALAHVEEALDRLSVGMLQLANGVVDWCNGHELSADEDALPPEAQALCFHLRATATALHAPRDACTSSRFWTRRLLDAGAQAAPREETSAHAITTSSEWMAS